MCVAAITLTIWDTPVLVANIRQDEKNVSPSPIIWVLSLMSFPLFHCLCHDKALIGNTLWSLDNGRPIYL